MNVAGLVHEFQRSYGSSPRIFSAPGRVNLIGEHTDYNEGFVLPIAINRRTNVAAAANNSNSVRVQSLDLNEQATFSLIEPTSALEESWLGYVAGVAFELQKAGVKLCGADLTISSDVPLGAGLSSSAALEISVGAALLAVSEQTLDNTSLAVAAQKAEHVYAGTRCGIMDQLTATSAEKDHALLIDCRSRELEHIEATLPDATVVICNTNVKHELAASAYNQRRLECEQATRTLRDYLPGIRALRDVNMDELRTHKERLPEVIYRRARHVVSENARTLQAAQALKLGDAEQFGRLMIASHESLRDDYEVSCPELDLMVELATKCEGALGARMTGGGFGGCTVNLVRSAKVESFTKIISTEYLRRTGIQPELYVVTADEGVKEMNW